jgi:hypothetical protein
MLSPARGTELNAAAVLELFQRCFGWQPAPATKDASPPTPPIREAVNRCWKRRPRALPMRRTSRAPSTACAERVIRRRQPERERSCLDIAPLEQDAISGCMSHCRFSFRLGVMSNTRKPTMTPRLDPMGAAPDRMKTRFGASIHAGRHQGQGRVMVSAMSEDAAADFTPMRPTRIGRWLPIPS